MFQKAINKYLQEKGLTMFSPKAVLFDMDGVLFDSMPYHAKAWKETADSYQLISSLEDFYLFEGRTGDSTINELFLRTFQREATEKEKKDIYKKKAGLFNKYNDGHPMPGAAEVLKQVKERGLKTILVTGSGQHSLLNKLNHVFPEIFERDKMVTGYDVKYGKPHPEPYLMGLEKAGVKAHEAIVVENAPMGVQAGVSAGIFTIAVNTGPLPDNVLIEAGANLLFPDMETLAEEEFFSKLFI